MAVKVLVYVVIIGGAVTGAFVEIWKITHETKGVTINGPVVGQQVGDHNKQDLTLVNERSGYLPPHITSSEHHVGYVGDGGKFEDAWITRVAFDRSPGIWDQSMITELSLSFDGPYESAEFPEGFGGFLLNGREIRDPPIAAKGFYGLGTMTAPAGDVVVAFRSRQPVHIVDWGVHPPGRPTWYHPGP